MNSPVASLRLQDAWRECERNAYHLQRALGQLRPLLPLTGVQFQTLTDAQIQTMDQFILRFTKLQDSMGSHLYPFILEYLQEPFEDRPMLDKLNRLEKLGYIENAEAWGNVRSIRNKFAHDYPDDPEKNAALINIATEAAQSMVGALGAIDRRLRRDHPKSMAAAYAGNTVTHAAHHHRTAGTGYVVCRFRPDPGFLHEKNNLCQKPQLESRPTGTTGSSHSRASHTA